MHTANQMAGNNQMINPMQQQNNGAMQQQQQQQLGSQGNQQQQMPLWDQQNNLQGQQNQPQLQQQFNSMQNQVPAGNMPQINQQNNGGQMASANGQQWSNGQNQKMQGQKSFGSNYDSSFSGGPQRANFNQKSSGPYGGKITIQIGSLKKKLLLIE